MMSACLENQPNSCNKVCTRSLTLTDFNGAVFTHEIFALCGFYVILIPSLMYILGWFKTPLSSQTAKLMAGTKFSDYLGLKTYHGKVSCISETACRI